MRRLVSLIVIVMGAFAAPALAQSAARSGAATPQAAPAPPTQQPQPSQLPTQTPAPQAPTPAPGQRGGRGQGGAPAGASRQGFVDSFVANPAVNVKLELSITDTYANTPAKKTVTLLVANGGNGMIRTSNRLPDGSPVNLNVDCEVRIVMPGGQARGLGPAGGDRATDMISTHLTFQYTPAQSAQAENRPAPRPADLNESVNVLLQDGKLTVVSQSADPATDRRVTVEVTATVMK